MQRVMIVFEYDGKEFCGYQIQNNAVTVQQTLEEALSKLLKEDIKIVASGRTDSGVSALNQVAHFDTKTTMPIDRIYLAVNTILPRTIKVKSSVKVDEEFHARFNAKKKTYLYRMLKSEVQSPLKIDTHEHISTSIDVEKMRKGCQFIVGEHDFNCFMASGSEVVNTIRTVYSCEIVERDNELLLYITGNGFLYNMVRIIAGTLIEIGLGKKDNMKDIIASRNRVNAGYTAPPHGLLLYNVEY